MLRISTAAAALLAGLVAFAQSGSAQAQALEKPNLDVAVGGKTLIAYLPYTIAERMGLFEKEGLKVTTHDFQGGSRSLQALVGGSADMVIGAYEHTIHTRAKGANIKAVGLMNHSFGLVVALAKAKAASYRSPKDLVGMKIGVTTPGSASAIGLAVLLARDNIKLDQVSVIAVGTGAQSVAVMKNGQIDAIANFDPAILLLETEGVIQAVVDTRTQAGRDYLYGGPSTGSGFYTRDDFWAKNPRTVQAFVNAMVKAMNWMYTAKTEDIVALVPPEFYAGGSKALYTKVVEVNRGAWSKDGLIDMKAAEATYKMLKTHEPALQNVTVDLKLTFDNSFAEKANAAIAKR